VRQRLQQALKASRAAKQGSAATLLRSVQLAGWRPRASYKLPTRTSIGGYHNCCPQKLPQLLVVRDGALHGGNGMHGVMWAHGARFLQLLRLA
jgi:hypothetical protein